jgi:hypothetical protein
VNTPPVWMHGTVVQGHRVASGRGGDPAFPGGTIRLQLDAFRAALPDLDTYLGGPPFAGTINVRIEGVAAVTPSVLQHRVGPVQWTDRFPPETFLLSRASLQLGDAQDPVMLYIPDPAAKPAHHQPANVVELLGAFVPALNYGASVRVGFPVGALVIR